MNGGEALADASRRLSDAGVDSPRRNARLLLSKAMEPAVADCPYEAAEVASEAQARLDAYVARRIAREPLAYILGHKEFWSLDFLVGPGALIPRPETESLIEELLNEFPDRTSNIDILDYGTGCGCLIVAALVMFPNATGLGCDISPEALDWARKNVARHRLEARCELRPHDWTDEIGGRYNAIIANPPYIKQAALTALAPEVARYEPGTSLVGGEDGLDAFRMLAPQIAKALKLDGLAFLEIGKGQAENVRAILAAAGLRVRRVVADLAGISRCVVVGLPEIKAQATGEKTVGKVGPTR